MTKFPYPGLRPFKTQESDIYFGRDEFIKRLMNELSNNHFIAVVGNSGCGKSSLVRAGLLSRLKLVKVGGRPNWRSAIMRPGDDPFCNLAASLVRDKNGYTLRDEFFKANNLVTEGDAIAQLQGEISSDLKHSYQKLENRLPSANYNLLIVVDQFEELFTMSQPEATERFIQWLLNLSYRAKSRTYVVITMRTEFLDECVDQDGLIQAVNDGFFQVPYLEEQQLRDSIVFPAQMCNGEVENDLVNRLLEDVKKMSTICRQDHLASLQHALVQMWLQSDSQKCLELQHYKRIGGDLSAVLTNSADKIYQESVDIERKVIEILFRRISRKDTSITRRYLGGSNENIDFFRDVVILNEVAELAGVMWQVVAQVVDLYRTPDCDFLFVSTGVTKKHSRIDVRHEAIIRQCDSIREWAEDEHKLRIRYKQWEEASQQWDAGVGELRRGRYLEVTEGLLERLRRLYPEDAQIKLWASRYGNDFDLAWEFLLESRAEAERLKKEAAEAQQREIDAQNELDKRQKQILFTGEQRRIAEEKQELAETARKLAEEQRQLANKKSSQYKRALVVGILVALIFLGVAGWGLYERDRAIQSEQIRTENLFESYRQYAALIAQNEQYNSAQKILANSHELDDKIAASPRHARDLLARFIDINSSQPQHNYSDAKSGLRWLYALATNGSIVATSGTARSNEDIANILLFDTEQKILLKRLSNPNGHKGTVGRIAFHPNKQWLISVGEDKKVIIWSLNTDEILQQWQLEYPVLAMAVYGDIIATGGGNNIDLWNMQGDRLEEPLTGHSESITNLAFSADGKLLASSSYDNTVMLWQMPSGQLIQTISGHTDNVQMAVFSPDNTKLAIASDDKTISLWDIASEKTYKVFSGHKDKVFALSFIDNGRYLVSASADATLRIWHVDSGITVHVLEGHVGFVNNVVTNEKNIFSVGTDRNIRQWDINLPHQQVVDLEENPTAIAIAQNGEKFALGFTSGNLQLRNLGTAQLLHSPNEAHQRDVQRLAFSQDNQLLASASLDNTAKIWRIKEHKLDLMAIIEHQAGVNAVAFTPDNKAVFTASYDGRMGRFDLDSQIIEFFDIYEEDMNAVSFDLSGKYVLTNSDFQADLWNINQWQQGQQAIITYPQIESVTWWSALSPNAEYAALVGDDFVVRVYHHGKLKHEFLGHNQTVIRAEFSPDSQQLFTISADNTVKVWDLLQDNLLFSLDLPTYGKDSVWDFAFRCADNSCWLAVPFEQDKQLILYDFTKIY